MIHITGTINNKLVEIHEDRVGRHRYWVKIDGRALFQRGRMRLRTFTTPGAAIEAAAKEARS
jgi:hypothetical protein